MRFLFFTYCFGRDWGEALIGVYKRGLRIALELHEQGHEIVFSCPGRDSFHDPMTARAEELFQFADDTIDVLLDDGEETRRQGLEHIREIAPDVVVIGEAPIYGTLLEAALCTAELGIPMVCIDNAYGPGMADFFCRYHGPLFDAVILSGPSTFHTQNPPSYLYQVPLFIESDPGAARRLVCRQLDLSGRRLMTVLAYEEKVEVLGVSLVEELADPDLEVVFVSQVPDGCLGRLEALSSGLRGRVRVIPPQPDPLHFGLLEISRLVVGKCGFMQIAECLSLRTPILTYRPPGGFELALIPEESLLFAEAADEARVDSRILATARRFLELDSAGMPEFHLGDFDAAARIAQILGALSRQVRPDITAHAASSGLTEQRLCPALAALHPGEDIDILWVRMETLHFGKKTADGLGFEEEGMVGLCCYRVGGVERVERLWVQSFADSEATRRHAARKAETIATAVVAGGPLHKVRRRLYHVSTEDCCIVERYVGNYELPSPD